MFLKIILLLSSLFLIVFFVTPAQNHHEWRKKGACLECHSQDDLARMASPQYHTAQFRQYTHGRATDLAKCNACHEISTCHACHQRIPESHTDGFINAQTAEGLERHILLGRLRPSSCLVCHQNFVLSCIQCHTIVEVSSWEKDAKKDLMHWEKLYAH